MKRLGFSLLDGDSRGREAGFTDFLFPAAHITDWYAAPTPVVNNIFEVFDPILNTLVFTRVIKDFTLDKFKKAGKILPAGHRASRMRFSDQSCLRGTQAVHQLSSSTHFSGVLEKSPSRPASQRSRPARGSTVVQLQTNLHVAHPRQANGAAPPPKV